METEIVEVRLPMLEKPYKYTGEYRPVKYGERYLHEGKVCLWGLEQDSEASNPIIEREPWVPAYSEVFFIVDWSGCVQEVEHVSDFTKDSIASGNYFQTRELAEAASLKVINIFKGCDHE